MRKVKFPFEFDVLDLVTDDLKQKLLPANTRMKELEKERDERRKVRKRTRKAVQTTPAVDHVGSPPPSVSSTVEVGGASAPVGEGMEVDTPNQTGATDEELGDEGEIRKREAEELANLIHPDLKADVGANSTGVYELVGMVTHKGASADSGHYIGYARADVVNSSGNETKYDDDHDQWIKFDDDKVSMMTADKVGMLDGGGEESAAYILLYRSKRFS